MNSFLLKLKELISKGIVPEQEDFSDDQRDYFDLIHNLKFLAPYLENPKTTELIFHCGSHLEIIEQQSRKHIQVEYPRKFVDLAFQMKSLQLKNRWNQKHYQVSYQTMISKIPVRVTMLHKVVQNADHKYFIRKREIQSFPLQSFHFSKDPRFRNSNIIISGATGSGKTSFLNSMIQEYCHDHHHVILEDTRELSVHSPFTTHLCSTERLESFCADAMRLSPQSLILGEMRSHEVVPFTLLLTSGHKGFMTTIHANSALDSLDRIALLYSLYARNPMNKEQLLTLLCKNIDYLVYIRSKRVIELLHIKGHKNGHFLYENIGQEALSEAV